MNPKILFSAKRTLLLLISLSLFATFGGNALAQTNMVKDVYTGGADSDPASITHIKDSLIFFVASSYDDIRQPYATDGTAEGTVKLLDSEEQDGSPWFIDFPVQFNNKVYFVAQSELYGTEVYVSDGTPAGSGILKDINPGDYYADADNLTVFKNRLFFAASDGDPHDHDETGTHGKELWATDGTESGTILIKNINEGTYTNPYDQEEANDSEPDDLTVAGDQLFFSADTENSGRELWVTDGTTSGTRLVKDIYPGTDSNGNAESSDPDDLIAMGDKVIFLADDGVNGTELWVSDGTEEGTFLVKDFDGEASSGLFSLNDPVVLNNEVYFEEDDEVWRTDGTTEGTEKLFALPEYTEDVLTVFDDQIVLQATSSLWFWNPSTSNLSQVSFNNLLYPEELTVYNNRLFFSAESSSSMNGNEVGRELFSTNGTEEGTMLIKDINRVDTTSNRVYDSRPEDLTVAGDLLYFTANTEANGRELWHTGGLPERTHIVDQNTLQPVDLPDFDLRINFSEIDTTIELTVLRDTRLIEEELNLPADFNLAKPGLWHITQDTAASFSADLYITPGELITTNADYTDLRILKRADSSEEWSVLSTSVEEINGEEVIATSAVESFSEFILAEEAEPTSLTENAQVKEQFRLLPAYPNPFNPSTTLRYQLPASAEVELNVYNVQGQLVATLVEQHQSAGSHEVTFNASDLASGFYFYRLKTENFTQTRAVTLIK